MACVNFSRSTVSVRIALDIQDEACSSMRRFSPAVIPPPAKSGRRMIFVAISLLPREAHPDPSIPFADAHGTVPAQERSWSALHA